MGGGLEFDLSRGAVPALWSCSLGSRWRPVLQVADARHVPDGSGLRPAPEQRYRVELSDGVHSQRGTLAASLSHLVREGTLRRGSVVRLLDFACDYHRRTITVIQLEILQTECALIGSLKLYEPIRKHGGFTTRSMRYAGRPDCEPHFGGQHIHQSCIASEVEESANGLSYHGPCGGSSLPGGDMPCSVAPYAEPAVWKTVRQVKDEYLGYLDEPDFITVKAVIIFINTDRLCSAACPMAVYGKRCNVKATGDGDGNGTWHCKACTQSYGSYDYGILHCKRCWLSFDSCDYGYSVRIRIQDHTGTTFATVYEEAAKEIFGCTAKALYLMEYEEQNYIRLEDIKLGVACKQYILRLKVEAKPFSDPRGVECVVLKAETVNPSAESRRLLGAMDAHLWEGLDSCWELGSSIPTSWDLSHFKGHSTSRSSNSGHAAKMSRDRANWDDTSISLLLDLVAKQKELCHWTDKGPTSIGWTNIFNAFNESTQKVWGKKQLQNKYSDLKRLYFSWCDGLEHTGLGRDPSTGEVAFDPVWYAAVNGEGSSQPSGDKYKRPPCCEQLHLILGHIPRERGELVSAGGHGTQQTCSGDSPQSPQDLSDEPILPRSAGQSTKRFIRSQSVSSPRRKKSSQTPSLDDCLEQLNDSIKDTRERKSRHTTEVEEMAKVDQILREDGYSEPDIFFARALNVCTNRVQRRAFLNMESKEGRFSYVTVTWEVMTMKSK